MARNQVTAKREDLEATRQENEALKARLALVNEALQVYGIEQKYVFGCGVIDERQEVIIVTNGGKKIRHKKGEAAKFTLSEVEITGIRPEIKMFRGGPNNKSDEMVWDDKLNGRRPKDKDIPPEYNFVWDDKMNCGRPVDR